MIYLIFMSISAFQSAWIPWTAVSTCLCEVSKVTIVNYNTEDRQTNNYVTNTLLQ